MSGDPPDDFKPHHPNNVLNSMSAEDFSNRLRNWIGIEGMLDMRSYLRFRVLEYFGKGSLDSVATGNAPISDKDFAVNLMVVDFILRHRYFFTLCLLLPEMHTFLGGDERFVKLKARLSDWSPTDQNSSAPLLDSEQINLILTAFNLPPTGEIGTEIASNYRSGGNSYNFIRVTMDALSRKDCTAAFNTVKDKQPAENGSPENVTFQTLKIKILEDIDQQMKELRRLTLFRGSREKYDELSEDVGILKEKVGDIFHKINEHGENFDILTELVSTLRKLSVRILRRCSSYVKLVHGLQQKTVELERSITKLNRRLAIQKKKSRSCSIKRFNSTFRRLRSVIHVKQMYNKSTHTISNDTCEGYTQTDVVQETEVSTQCVNEIDDRSANTRNRLKQILNDFNEMPPPSQNVRTNADQKLSYSDCSCRTKFDDHYEETGIDKSKTSAESLQKKIRVQSEELENLSARITSLQSLLKPGEIDSEVGKSNLVDATIQTERSALLSGMNSEARPSHQVQHSLPSADSFTPCINPLAAVFMSAKIEIAALKRERMYLEEEHNL